MLRRVSVPLDAGSGTFGQGAGGRVDDCGQRRVCLNGGRVVCRRRGEMGLIVKVSVAVTRVMSGL